MNPDEIGSPVSEHKRSNVQTMMRFLCLSECSNIVEARRLINAAVKPRDETEAILDRLATAG